MIDDCDISFEETLTPKGAKNIKHSREMSVGNSNHRHSTLEPILPISFEQGE